MHNTYYRRCRHHHNIFIIVSLIFSGRTYYVLHYLEQCVVLRLTTTEHALCLRTIFYLILFHLIELKYLKNNRQTKTAKCFHLRCPSVCVNVEICSAISPISKWTRNVRERNSEKWNFIACEGEKKTSQKRKIVVSIRTLVIHSCCLLVLLLCNDSRALDISVENKLSLTLQHVIVSFVHCFTVISAAVACVCPKTI